MKKLLFVLLAAMLLPMALQAQLIEGQNIKFQKAPNVLKNFNQRLNAPARADLGDHQMILGAYDTDDLATAEDGLGITGLPGVLRLGTILTPSDLEIFQGGKIIKFRVGLANATAISTVFVAPVSASGSIGNLTTWSCSANAAGWSEIELSTPYEINLDSNQSLMIGFDYRQTSNNYPISAVDVGEIHTTYLYYSNTWQDVGLTDYGNLSVQCVVESDNFPDYKITASKLNVNNYIKTGDDIAFAFNTKNSGANSTLIDVNGCTYDVFIDSELVTTIGNPEPFGRSGITIESVVPSTGLASGKHTLTVTINSLNGEPVENPVSISRNFFIYTSTFDRQMHLVEEYTSNSCTYCPYGANTLKNLMNLRDDVAMVAIHGNQSAVDPCNTAQCDTLESYVDIPGWPSATFNRSVGWVDDVTIANSIGYNPSYQQMAAQAMSDFLDDLGEAIPSFATVNINSTFDPETRDAVITIDGKLTSDFDALMGEDAKLSVFVSEDGLVYRQLNLGTWVSNYTHNHVFRKALGSAFGVKLNKVEGDKYTNTFELNVPADWNVDNMEIVAFISRPLANGATGVYTDMYVDQANKRKFGEFDETEVLRGDVNGDGNVDISDAIVLISYLLGNPEEITGGADCNFDEVVNISDATVLINFVLNGEWSE